MLLLNRSNSVSCATASEQYRSESPHSRSIIEFDYLVKLGCRYHNIDMMGSYRNTHAVMQVESAACCTHPAGEPGAYSAPVKPPNRPYLLPWNTPDV
jgi:hypothetical protein